MEAGEPLDLQASTAHDRRGGPVLNSTVAIGPKDADDDRLAAAGGGARLSSISRSGGTGKDCELPGGKLPMSAQLMFARFEKALAARPGRSARTAGRRMRSGSRTRTPRPMRSAPFAGCKRTILPIRLAIADAEPCELVFTFPGVQPDRAVRRSRQDLPTAPRSACSRCPNAEPFGGIPLPLKAILVDMAIPVATLAKLEPGMMIPVTVARSVPLVAGEQVVAHGTVGAMDDCTALQLTRITAIKEK